MTRDSTRRCSATHISLTGDSAFKVRLDNRMPLESGRVWLQKMEPVVMGTGATPQDSQSVEPRVTVRSGAERDERRKAQSWG